MRLNLLALAVAPIVISIVSALSRSQQPEHRPREVRSVRRYEPDASSLLSRNLEGVFLSHRALEARQVAPYRSKPRVDKKGNVKEKKKLTASEQQARKDGKKQTTNTATAANRDKRLHWQSLTPQARKEQRLNKPKMPRLQMAKGATQSTKSQAKQAAAKQRISDRKAAGKTKFASAKAEYGKMKNLPGRHDTFTVKGGSESATGRQVRTAVFNSKYFAPNQPIVAGLTGRKAKKNTLAAPGTFANRPQGPEKKPVPPQYNGLHQGLGQKKLPIKGMKGSGTEFPIGPNRKGGFQGGSDDKGGMRVVTQGNKFKGVIAHDPSRTDPTAKGYMDHFRVQPKRAPKPRVGR